jgi:hypothetical protein
MKWVTVPVVVLALLVLSWGCVFVELGLGEGSSVQWQRSFFSGDGCSVFQTSDGGYVVSANDSVNSFLIKTDSLGNQV